jgi:hypothetical protein
VRGPVAANGLQKHGVLHPPAEAEVRRHRVADLVGAGRHDETAPTELDHLGHERQRVELTPLVERGQDLAGRTDLDDVTFARGA